MKRKFWNGKLSIAEEMNMRFANAESDNKNLQGIPCPSCGNKSLRALSLTRGNKKDWEVQFRCESCSTTGVANDIGFHLDIKIKGEPQKDELMR